MNIKNIYLISLIGLIFTLSSCSVDPAETLPGTWSTSDGGTITFDGDGSGTTTGSEYFEFDCGTLNGTRLGPVTNFTWSITEGGSASDNLHLEFSDPVAYPNCAGSIEFPIDFNGKNKATVGIIVFGIGEEVELTR